jgi:hypothetical protein
MAALEPLVIILMIFAVLRAHSAGRRIRRCVALFTANVTCE